MTPLKKFLDKFILGITKVFVCLVQHAQQVLAQLQQQQQQAAGAVEKGKDAEKGDGVANDGSEQVQANPAQMQQHMQVPTVVNHNQQAYQM